MRRGAGHLGNTGRSGVMFVCAAELQARDVVQPRRKRERGSRLFFMLDGDNKGVICDATRLFLALSPVLHSNSSSSLWPLMAPVELGLPRLECNKSQFLHDCRDEVVKLVELA